MVNSSQARLRQCGNVWVSSVSIKIISYNNNQTQMHESCHTSKVGQTNVLD